MLQLTNLKRLYGSNACVRAILDHFYTTEEHREETPVLDMWAVLRELAYPFSRHDVIKAFKSLDHVGAGAFIVGRRRYPSRFFHIVDIVELAKAARGERDGVQTLPGAALAAAPATAAAASPAAAAPSPTAEGDPAAVLGHRYILRPDFLVTVQLPADLTKAEATRLAEFIRSLPFA